MIKIPVSEIREFLSRAASVGDNFLIPVLSYIKLECTKDRVCLIKNNSNSFVIHTINIDSVEYKKRDLPLNLLLDKAFLKTAANMTTEDMLEFSVSSKEIEGEKGKTITIPMITIKDGAKVNLKFQTDDPANFPVTLMPDTDSAVLLDKSVMEGIAVCYPQVCEEEGKMPWLYNLYVLSYDKKSSVIFASNNNCFIYRVVQSTLPKIILTQASCKAISGYEQTYYSNIKNYHFFNSGKTIHGFIEVVQQPADVANLIKALKLDTSFSVNRKELISFCESVKVLEPLPLAYISLQSSGDGKLMLDYSNEQYQRFADWSLDMSDSIKMPLFFFNSKYMIMQLKSFSSDNVTFYPGTPGQLLISGNEDEGYGGAICEVMMQQ